ncbi:MAG TPA: GAF domain-containing protein, partial [Firmicutes bacterium]|nr:GAF domain-containing protein [Bacillota bacterium]
INKDNCRFKKVVELIVNRVSKILDAEMAGVMLYDEKSKELVLQKPAFGLENDEDINAYRVPINGKGNAVNVFLTGVPSISNNTPSDPRFLKNFVLKYGARNTITVPLEVNAKRIGVLHVDNKNSGDFTQKDVELLGLLSSHMALLLENAAYIENEKIQQEQLKEINENLSNQQKKLRKLMDIHGKLIRKVLYGEGLSAVTQTLTELLNSKVIVEDKHFNIVCQASPVKKECNLESSECLKNIKDYRSISVHLREAVLKKKAACISPLPEEGINYYRVLVPLMDKNGILGYLSVLFNNDSFGEFDMIAIEQAALVASLELVKEKNAYEIEGRIKGEFLDLLLQGDYKNEKEILERAKFLNYDISEPQLVAIIKIQKKSNTKKDLSIYLQKPINNTIFLLNKSLSQYILLLRGNELIILCPGHEQDNIKKKLKAICVEIEKKYSLTRVVAGIGEPVKEILKIKDSFQQAKRVLQVAGVFDMKNVTAYSDLGIYNIIFGIKEKSILENYVKEKIGALLEHDNKKKGSLLLTLETFLATKSIIKKAAEKLFIHVKTMEYRLKRIEEILGIDLSDAETCLELNMAIKIYKLL